MALIELIKSLKHSITRRLLTIVFSVYVVVTITVTVSHMYLEYANAKETIQEDLRKYENIIRDSLSQAMWTFTTSQIDALIKGAMTSKIITGIEVESYGDSSRWQAGFIPQDSGGYQYYSPETQELLPKKGPLGDSISWRFDFTHEEASENIGGATIYSNTSVALEQVRMGFFLIIINAVIKTIALWIFFLWAGFYYLSKPLYKLTDATQALSRGQGKAAKVPLSKQNGYETELDILAKSFNSMIDRLDEAQEDLVDTKELILPRFS